MLRPKLNRLWGGSNASTRRDPTDAKYIIGWVSEIPTFQVLNYLQYKMDTTMLAQAERGVFEWGGDVTYVKGALAWDELDKQVYVSQVANPSKTLAPSNNPTQWKVSSVQITRQQYDTLNANITAHIADITGNPHQLTAGRLNSYTKAETDALIAQYQALVKAHVDNKNNPHGTTAAQIGAVPITGGTYTGDVIFAAGRILLDAAGSNKVGLLSGSGLFLQSGSGVLGLNSAGVAVAGTVASQSPIVTEQTFAAQKALVEPDYAIPAPVYVMPLIGDINIYTGSGTFGSLPTSAIWDAQFDSKGLVCLAEPTFRSLLPSACPIPLATECSIAIDITFADLKVATATSQAIFAFGWGNAASNFRFLVNARRVVSISTGLQSPAIMDTKTHRFVITRNSTRRSIYMDGVLLSTTSATLDPVSDDTTYGIYKYGTAAAEAQIQLSACNFRTWNVELTAKQVSNL